ncbi:MAG: hypothetical protein DIU79_13175 [Actinobacteria bacterium]|nr:MAG: hypothetical protein DIU79_13175 [Actinomycetota bacterium]
MRLIHDHTRVVVPRSSTGRWRRSRIGLLAGVVVAAGVFGSASAAHADVTVTPSVAIRGGGVNITFEVPNERDGAYTTKVEIRLPEETPAADVFPLSVPDWAPKLTERRLATPIAGHHAQIWDVTDTITWIRVVSPPAEPEDVVRLPISVGVLPNAERIEFTLVQTYSDGTVVRWGEEPDRPAPVLTLRPSPAPPLAEQLAADDEPAPGEGAVSTWALFGAGLAIGVGLAAVGWFLSRLRRPEAASRWRLREP